jgi:hypothetical protein
MLHQKPKKFVVVVVAHLHSQMLNYVSIVNIYIYVLLADLMIWLLHVHMYVMQPGIDFNVLEKSL